MPASIVGKVLEVLGQPTAAIEPCQGALDHPAHRQHDEAFGLVRSLDDLYRQMGQAFRDSFGKLWSLITGIGKQFGQKRIHPEQCGQQQRTTITVLDIRRMHDGVQQQS